MPLVYVALLDEGTEVWRPTEAVHLGGDRYRIVSPASVPEGERWEFPPGSVVRCSERVFHGGQTGLVAVQQQDEV